MSVLPGYVRFDDGSRVKINLNSRSKSDIKHLKRKLANELDQVRSLRKKLDSKEKFQSSFNDNFNNRITGNSGGDRIGTLDRANSEVSYVGQTNSRPLYGNKKKKNPVNSKKKLPKTMPLEMRTLGGTYSLMKAANSATDQARVVLQDRKEADHNILGTKFTSATAEAPKDLGSVQVTHPASSPIKEHKQGHCMSRSSSSSSFGCGSRSSSSGSDIDSSSGARSGAGR
ncbi:hypothetical protein OIU78_024965 [Salix suchowensis]|nr:hypothetical protein OIU78_024965 [Salix suchowensis]